MTSTPLIDTVSDSTYKAQEELLFRTTARLKGLFFYRAFALVLLIAGAWYYHAAAIMPWLFWTVLGLLTAFNFLNIYFGYIGSDCTNRPVWIMLADACGYTLLAMQTGGFGSYFVYFYYLLLLYTAIWFSRRLSYGVGALVAACMLLLYGMTGHEGETARLAVMLLSLLGLTLGTAEIASLVSKTRERMVAAAMELILANKRVLAKQEELQASEARMRLVLDTAAEAIFGIDFEGRCIFANRSCIAMLGYASEADLLGKNMHALVHHTHSDGRHYPEEECPVRLSTLRGESAHNDEEVVWRADGTPIAVEYWSHPIRHEQQLVGAVTTFIDITERKRAEEALRASEEKLRKMFEFSPLGIILNAMDGRFVDANPAMLKMVGYSLEEFNALSYWDLTPKKYEADEARQLVSLNDTGRYGPYEKEYLRKDGTLVPIALNGVLITGSDGQQYIWSTVEDITERKRAERELRLTRYSVEHASELLIRVAESGRVLDVNDTTCAVLGYSREELLSMYTHQFQLGLSAKSWAEHWEMIRERGRYTVEREFRTRDGRIIPMEVEVHYLEYQGEAYCYKAARDITERKRAEAELRQLNLELEDRVEQRTRELAESNHQLKEALGTLQHTQDELVRSEKLASLGSLVAGVAHELNTPLGNSLTVATTLADKLRAFDVEVKSGSLRRTALNEFVEHVQKATTLLNRNLFTASELITHFKQVAVDQTSAQRRPFDLAETVNEVVMTLQPQFKKTPHKIELEIPRGIRMDSFPGPLGQVITNLVTNALVHAFSEQAAGTVRIEAAIKGDQVRLVVSDNGQGIAQEHQAKIFDPFFTTRLGQGGSGLGLHIVYSIITRVLGGRIIVASQKGEGSTFTLELPLQAPEQAKGQIWDSVAVMQK